MVALIRRSPNGVYAVRPFFRTFNVLDEVEDMAKRAWDTTMTPRVDMYEEEEPADRSSSAPVSPRRSNPQRAPLLNRRRKKRRRYFPGEAAASRR